MNETYHYGQGRVELAERLSDGSLGPWYWLGDVSELTLSLEEGSFSHRESYSGLRHEVRNIYDSITASGSMTLHTLSAANLALFALGTASAQAAGSVTDEDLGTVEVGDVLRLAKPGVSNLIITDSAMPTPATIAATHYSVNVFGDLTILSLPSSPAPTMPLKASYSHAANNQVALLNRGRKEYSLRYQGVNLAEDSAPCELELYKVSPGLLQTLSLITSGQQLASTPVSYKPLLDTSKPASGPLGQYGRYTTIGY